MVAQNTVKINGVWYKAGDTIPDGDKNVEKAVSAPVVEPPKPIAEEKQEEEKKPAKRQYSRRK